MLDYFFPKYKLNIVWWWNVKHKENGYRRLSRETGEVMKTSWWLVTNTGYCFILWIYRVTFHGHKGPLKYVLTPFFYIFQTTPILTLFMSLYIVILTLFENFYTFVRDCSNMISHLFFTPLLHLHIMIITLVPLFPLCWQHIWTTPNI